MNFIFSKRSLRNLEGVSPDLVRVAYRALSNSTVDFGIVQGLRSADEQKENVKKGSSQTIDSKHLTGNAIDVVAFMSGNISWQSSYYFEIANAFAKASNDLNIKIRWGGAWNIDDIGNWSSDMSKAHDSYLINCKVKNHAQFNDFGHFELNFKNKQLCQSQTQTKTCSHVKTKTKTQTQTKTKTQAQTQTYTQT